MPTPRTHSTNADRQKAYRERQAAARLSEQEAKGLPSTPPIPTMPGTARWKALLNTAQAQIEAARDEMQTYHDDRTERWQEGDHAESLIGSISQLDDLIDTLSSIEV